MIRASQIIESYYLIRSAYDQDDYSKVIEIYQNKIHEEPTDPSVRITYGLICQIVGSSLKKINEGRRKEDWMSILEKSLLIFKEYIESNQTSMVQKIDLQLNYANTLCILDNPSEAFKFYDIIKNTSRDFEVISKMNVGRSYAHYCLKQFELGLKDAEDAINFFEKNSSNIQNKQLAYAHNNKGLNLFEMGNILEAKEAFTIAYELFPKEEFKANLNNIEVRRIQSLIENNNINEAIQLLPGIINSEQQKKLNYNIGVKKLEKQDIEDAKKYFSKALVLDPTFELAKIGLAECLRRIGEYEKAKKLTEDLDPNSRYHISAKNLIGSILFDQLKYQEALTFFKSAIDSLENTKFQYGGTDVPTLYRNYAMCLFELNRIEEGRDYYKKAEEYVDVFQKQILSDFI